MGSGASKPTTVESGNTNSRTASPPPSFPEGGGCPVKHSSNSMSPPQQSNTQQQLEESSASSSKCPMHNEDGSYSYDWWALFRPSFPHRPGGDKPMDEAQLRARITRRATFQDGAMASPGGVCPVQQSGTSSSTRKQQQQQQYNVYSQPIDPKNNMPKVANQMPAPHQSKALSTDRVTSSIPKGGADEGTTWTYPSPQMFYNALARKGKLGDTGEEEIDSVVALHNNMNEKTWSHVQEWEAVVTGDPQPKLLKFTGRPTDLSPKAWLKHYVLGHPLPYDRHDWTILRSDGTTVRYVIDYYHDETRASDEASSAKPQLKDTAATPSLLVDVRPALDGPSQLWNRMVSMPTAIFLQKSTNYEYLPLRPSPEMKSQVQESVSVWASIQAAASGKAQEGEQDSEKSFKLTKEQAEALVADFGKALKACPAQQKRLTTCKSDEDCAKASVAYTLCLAKIMCPIQHTSFTKALQDESEHADARIESALEVVNECVVTKTTQRNQARKDYGI